MAPPGPHRYGPNPRTTSTMDSTSTCVTVILVLCSLILVDEVFNAQKSRFCQLLLENASCIKNLLITLFIKTGCFILSAMGGSYHLMWAYKLLCLICVTVHVGASTCCGHLRGPGRRGYASGRRSRIRPIRQRHLP